MTSLPVTGLPVTGAGPAPADADAGTETAGPGGGGRAAFVGRRALRRPGRSRSRRRVLAVAVALAVVVAAVAVAVAVAATRSPHHAPTARPSAVPFKVDPAVDFSPPLGGPGPPGLSSVAAATANRLRSERLFVAAGPSTEAVGADGVVLQRLGRSEGSPAQPVVAGADTVVYLAAGRAYGFDLATGAAPVSLGAAQAVFSAGSGRVVLVARSAGSQLVTRLDAALHPIDRSTLAGSDLVVGASAAGLLVETPHQVLDLVRSGRPPIAVTGPISRVVAFSGDELAWTSVAGCAVFLTSDCPLHLTNVATRVDRVVDVVGSIGFAAIGSFSPDGSSLAVYELSDRRQELSALDLVVVRVSTGVARRIGSVLDAGAFTPTVTWSPSGEWLFYGGSGSFDALDFAPSDPAGAPGGPVPLPVSVTCCVVGF